MRTVSFATACKILGQTPNTISGWRNRIGGRLAELGGKGEARFELRDLALLALIAELRASNRMLSECAASALAFQDAVDDVFLERVPAGEKLWLIEASWPSGRVKRLSGLGTEGLGLAIGPEIAAGASGFQIIDLSQMCARVQHAWLAAMATASAVPQASYTMEGAGPPVPADAPDLALFPGQPAERVKTP